MMAAFRARPRALSRRLLPVLAVTALSAAACGSTTPSATPPPAAAQTPKSTPSPSASATPSSITLSAATLTANDFATGAKDAASSDVPDLTSVKCTPSATSGLQQQYKSEITAASGRVYGNVVAAFDTSSDAHSFITAFFDASKSCSDAASQPLEDNFGDYSFYFTITGSPNNLRVETVQAGNKLTLVIQVLPAGTQPDQQSLRDATQASLAKLQQVSG